MNTILKSKKYYAVLLVLLVIVIALPFIRGRKKFFSNSGVVWTTNYHITYEAKRDLNDSIQFLLNAIDNSVSPYNKQSLITAVNDNKTNRVDALFVKLFNKSWQVIRPHGHATG